MSESELSRCKVSVQVMSEQQMEVRRIEEGREGGREGGRGLIVTKVTQLSSPLTACPFQGQRDTILYHLTLISPILIVTLHVMNF